MIQKSLVGVTFDPAKRIKTLAERGLDFLDAEKVLAGRTLTFEDDRKSYPERRWITVGLLEGRMVLIVWTPRDGTRRVISMRKANGSEQERYGEDLA